MVICRALASFLPRTASSMARAPVVAGAVVPFLFGIHRITLSPPVEPATILLGIELAHADARAVGAHVARSRRASVVADAFDWMVEMAEAGAYGWHGPSADGERHKTKKQRKLLRKLRNSSTVRE